MRDLEVSHMFINSKVTQKTVKMSVVSQLNPPSEGNTYVLTASKSLGEDNQPGCRNGYGAKFHTTWPFLGPSTSP